MPISRPPVKSNSTRVPATKTIMLRVSNLRKSFAGKEALKGVSFEVKKGEIYGLLGHNGAGKSTTVGIILGMVAADGGEVEIDGVSVMKDHAAALRKVGAIFEAPAFYDYMSGWELSLIHI